jgi:hypothetical protein
MSGEVFDPKLVKLVVHRMFAGIPEMVANPELVGTIEGWENMLVLQPVVAERELLRRRS